jgi:uncharacterized protein (TIGR02599 family)
MRFKWQPAEGKALHPAGFTLLEILAAVTLLAMILVMTGSIISSSSRAWRQANAKIETFQEARAAFDVMTGRLSRATLNTYWDYYDSARKPFRLSSSPATFVPDQYGRYSDLHFLCGPASSLITGMPPGISAVATQAVFFIAPTGLSSNADYSALPGLLSACGYFVGFGHDDASKPGFLSTPSRYRWRLMELSAPAEKLSVFTTSSGDSWATTPLSQGQVRAVAENVIALVVWPKLSAQDDPTGTQISSDYAYDSRTSGSWSGTPPRQPAQAHQLPPNLQLTLVVIDEISARRIEKGSAPPTEITTALSGLFTNNVTQYADDLKKLQDRLAASNIGYRVFSTTVSLRESKWSP